MKALTITSVQYQLLLKSYKAWLCTLNYSESVIKSYPISVRELLHFLECKGVTKINELKQNDFHLFIQHVEFRKNEVSAGGLSANSINNIINGVTKFISYLRLTKDIHLNIELTRLKTDSQQRTILTQDEIGGLLISINAAFNPIAKRNKAILCILYSCGLRRNELVQLNIEDISFTRKTLHVKHGKGGKERLIPLIEPFLQYIKDYVRNCRDAFEKIAKEADNALFIDVHGMRISGDYLGSLVKKLVKESGVESLQDKRISLHSFRHSIATHLLQKGMDIESIAQLLGHSSLDSTMIYTHIVEQLEHENDG